MFSSIFSLLGLSFSLNTSVGRPLSLVTALASGALLAVSAALLLSGPASPQANAPALAAAFLMVLRAFGVVLLPPRGDLSGVPQAAWSALLGLLAAAAWWWILDRNQAPVALAAALLLSWPQLIDGINAFADKVFHKAALAAGARDIAPGTFTRIAQARDILIDKAAVMSGPGLMVTNVMAFNNDPKTLLAVAASAEAGSSHPVALALRELASQWQVGLKMPDRFEPTPGLGVVALLGGQTVVIGTTDLLKRLKIDSFTADAIARSLEADGKTVLRVAVGGRVVGVLGLEGTLRQDAGVAGMALRKEGLVPWLFSGDNPNTRRALASMLGLELTDSPKPGETASEVASRCFPDAAPLVLTLSQDRMALELRQGIAPETGSPVDGNTPLAVSDTDDIGAFPALKALAMRRNLLAVHARRVLSGLWLCAGLCGASTVLPLSAAPIVFGVCLAVLWTFARFSVADTLQRNK
ncbi:HAD family hydrolase [Stappia sp. BW2]|uniref:HAD family hydrolase n=1 Tax=Stappia sp. BW2 TaxID=2592622 RepID=UPI0011DE6A66|nr:HAD family hydrolase [Stappia sp. BW2]TYC72274.1 HAD family hydrolase [Stappia sp. BW2]